MNRWNIAQTYEKSWWENHVDSIDLEYLQDYANILLADLDGILNIGQNTKILEIGSGPAGIITFLKSDYRYAIDPLEPFFASIEKFTKFRNKAVSYSKASAEKLPFGDNMIDLIIIDNVLDHCQDMKSIFSELQRVLHPKGIIYIRLNVYHWWGKMVRLLAEYFQIDEGHPHTFTKNDLEHWFSLYGFITIKKKRKGLLKVWYKQLTSFNYKDFLKAITFSSPDTVKYFLSRQ